jgi:hypothetical protein
MVTYFCDGYQFGYRATLRSIALTFGNCHFSDSDGKKEGAETGILRGGCWGVLPGVVSPIAVGILSKADAVRYLFVLPCGDCFVTEL